MPRRHPNDVQQTSSHCVRSHRSSAFGSTLGQPPHERGHARLADTPTRPMGTIRYSKTWAVMTSVATCAGMMTIVLLLLLPLMRPPNQSRFVALTELFMCLVVCVEIVFGVLWMRDLGHGKTATLAAVLAASFGPLRASSPHAAVSTSCLRHCALHPRWCRRCSSRYSRRWSLGRSEPARPREEPLRPDIPSRKQTIHPKSALPMDSPNPDRLTAPGSALPSPPRTKAPGARSFGLGGFLHRRQRSRCRQSFVSVVLPPL